MEHWGFNTMSKKVTMLTLAAAFTVGVAACGGGGGSDSSTSSGSVGGLAVEGPVSGGTVTVLNANGSTCSAAGTTTSTSATFTLNIGSCTPPLAIVLSGGTDAVHSTMGAAVAQTNMRSIVGTTSQSKANISPFSTLIYYAMVGNSDNLAAASVTTANASEKITSKAKTILTSFGFGVDSDTDGGTNTSFDPITANLNSSNYATFIQASEALSETVRRIALKAGGINSANLGSVFAFLGKDLSDGSQDGMVGTTALSTGISGFDANSVIAYAQVYALIVINEVFSAGGLSVTNTAGVAASALSAIKSSITGVSSGATSSFDKVKASTTAVAQWEAAKTSAFKTLGVTSLAQLGISSDLTTSAAVASRPLTVDTAKVSAAIVTVTSASIAAGVSAIASSTAAANSFNVTLSTITLTDYPSNKAVTLTPSTPSISSGVLTVTIPSTSTVSASNLTLLAATTASSATATPAVINFNLASPLVAGSGTAGVTMSLLDGSDSTRSSGERSISATFNVPWSSNGTTLTLTKPTGASVSYYSISATSASTATLSTSSVDSLLITSSGSNETSKTTGLKMQIAELFNTATKDGGSALATALTSTTSAGSYFYSIDFSGINLAGTNSSSSTSTFSRVQGSFIAK